ncbi:MAG: hypothetical protein ACRDVE_18255 [Actinocrinis sp.]
MPERRRTKRAAGRDWHRGRTGNGGRPSSRKKSAVARTRSQALAPGQNAVPAGRDHQGRARRALPGRGRPDAAALRERPLAVARYPTASASEIRENKRGGRQFLDITRNAYAQLAVAPYTVRAVSDARDAMPPDWSEFEDKTLLPSRFTMRTIPERLADTDPWHDPPAAVSLDKARECVEELPR